MKKKPLYSETLFVILGVYIVSEDTYRLTGRAAGRASRDDDSAVAIPPFGRLIPCARLLHRPLLLTKYSHCGAAVSRLLTWRRGRSLGSTRCLTRVMTFWVAEGRETFEIIC
jgi:hypothetical protein